MLLLTAAIHLSTSFNLMELLHMLQVVKDRALGSEPVYLSICITVDFCFF